MELTQQQLLEKIDEFIDKNKSSLIGDLGNIIAIRSVKGKPAKNAPFGEGPRAALDLCLSIAERLGLETDECNGYMGWAHLKGKSDKHIATITHLDVVPEGEGWAADPFTLRMQKGWLLGRGVADDKGPAIVSLYVAKFFKELGIPLQYGLRVLLGCDEESGMEDIEYYLKHYPQPLFCVSPDTDFPVCNGEKGGFDGNFVSPVLKGNLVDFKGGIAVNVIPDRAFCVVKTSCTTLPPAEDITISIADGKATLEAKGIGGHASTPQNTRNAIGMLVDYLLQHNLCSEQENEFLQLLQTLHSATDGSGLGINCQEEVFGPLTCIGGTIEHTNNRLIQSMDIRFPMATSGKELTEKLTEAAANYKATLTEAEAKEPFFVPEDSAPIAALSSTYAEVTGLDATPYRMGGGTYARHFTLGVSFGPEMPGEEKPSFAGPIHGANESISISSLLTGLRIYILSIWKLQQLEENDFLQA